MASAPRGGHVRDASPGFLLGKLADWSREKSLWPVTFGLACCAIEMMATRRLALRHGALRLRALPRLARARPT